MKKANIGDTLQDSQKISRKEKQKKSGTEMMEETVTHLETTPKKQIRHDTKISNSPEDHASADDASDGEKSHDGGNMERNDEDETSSSSSSLQEMSSSLSKKKTGNIINVNHLIIKYY